MKIDLERLSGRENKEFYFDSFGSDEYLKELEGKYLKNLKVNVLVERAGEYYLARGRVITALELQCSRCLDRLIYPVDIEFKLYLADSDYQEEFSRDEDVVFYSLDEVEIQPYIEELVFSDIPLIPLCNTKCRGLCPQCGNNLNVAECKCRHENTDPRWDKLKELKAGKEVT